MTIQFHITDLLQLELSLSGPLETNGVTIGSLLHKKMADSRLDGKKHL